MTVDSSTRRLWRFSWLAAALVLAACAGVDPETELRAAADSLAAGRLDEASIRLNNVIQVQPDNAEVRRLRGELALQTGDYAAAAAELERARALGIPVEEIGVGLADAWVAQGRADQALAVLDTVAGARSANAAYWVVRAEALLRAGRVSEAERALDSSEEAGGAGARGQIVRGAIAFERNDVAGAEELYRRALEAAPNDASLLMARASLYAQTQRFSEAAADLSRAADLYRAESSLTREISALVGLMQIQLAMNDLDAAEATGARLVERAPRAALTSYFQALVAYRLGRFDEAADYLQPLVSALPESGEFRSLLGAVHLARGELGQAEQQFLAVLARTPNDPAAIKLLAETRLRQQRPEAALSALRSVDEAAAEDAQIGLLSGLASLQAGDTEQAIVYLEQAAALDPANELLKLQLARAYLSVGRSEDASALLQAAPGSGSTRLEAAMLRVFAEMRQGGSAVGDEAARTLLDEFPRDPRALTAAGTYFRLRGDNRRAREVFEQAAELETDGSVARMIVAATLVQEGRRDDAERLLGRVVAQQPDNAQALSGLAELAMARGAFDEAAELLGRAAEHTTSVSPRLALAQLHMRQGDTAAAKEQLDLAARAAPDNAEVTAVSGLLALAEGRPQDAVRLLESAETQLPNRLGVSLSLARAQLATGQAQAAGDTARRVLAVAPRSLPLRLILGAAELRLGNAEEAFSIAAELKAEYPSESGGYILEADAQIATRRYAAAADTLATAFEREPTWPVLTRLLAAQQLAGRSADAVAAAQQWVGANPQHVAGRLTLAGLLQVGGRNAQALEQYQAIIAIDGNHVPALNNAAWLMQELGRPGALELAQRAQALERENPAVLDTLGWILLAQDREADAIEPLSRAAELAPDALEIRYHLAQALVAGGQSAEARSLLAALVNESADFQGKADARRLLESL